jgi:broad specificity phosphatase PhoE
MTRTEHKTRDAAREVPLTVFFVRHGQAMEDDGSNDLGPSLTNLGERQAERVARRLSQETFNHIYSSDLVRAWQTTQVILKYHHHSTWTVTADLREVSYHHFAPSDSPPALSTKKSLREERLALERFTGLLRRAHVPGQKVLVVCHGNVIRSLIPMLGGRRPEKSVLMDLNNTAVSIIDMWLSGEAVLKLANCTKHLIPRQVT